jgi:hypothetical protein
LGGLLKTFFAHNSEKTQNCTPPNQHLTLRNKYILQGDGRGGLLLLRGRAAALGGGATNPLIYNKPRREKITSYFVIYSLKFSRLAGKIFLNHKSYLEGYRMVKLTKVKTCELSYFFKSVNESVSVNEKLS